MRQESIANRPIVSSCPQVPYVLLRNPGFAFRRNA
jgi:hypothetical protein